MSEQGCPYDVMKFMFTCSTDLWMDGWMREIIDSKRFWTYMAVD